MRWVICLGLAACEANTAPLDSLFPVDSGVLRPDGGPCQAEPVLATGLFKTADRGPETVRVTNGYFIYVGYSGSPQGDGLWRAVPGSEPVLVAPEVTRLLDVGNAAGLALRGTELAWYQLLDGSSRLLTPQSGNFTQYPVRTFRDNGYAWLDSGGVAYQTGLVAPDVFSGVVGWPDVAVDDLIIPRPAGIYQVYGPRVYELTQPDVEWFRGGSDGIYFGTFDQVIRRQGEQSTEIISRGCQPPDIEGTSMVFNCNGENMIFEGGQELIFHDGLRTFTIASTETGVYFSPKVSGRWVAWIQYDDQSVVCHQAHGLGKVQLYDLLQEFPVTTIAYIGAPCLCCGAYWPTPALDLEGVWLGWTYAQDGVGWAQLQPTCQR